jgi:hypothetical protein
MNNLRKVGIALLGALAVSVGGIALITEDGQAAGPDGFQIAVDEKGAIRLPDIDYRKDWASLGAWAVAAEEGTQGSQGIHAVYTQPATVDAFRETGRFPDGAILIKELFSTTTDDMTTGTVSRADNTSGWFVMIKDSIGRYPDNKLWGDGWGWAYFDAKDRINTPTTDYKTDCLGCHVPVKDQDWVYVQGYPVLRAQ